MGPVEVAAGANLRREVRLLKLTMTPSRQPILEKDSIEIPGLHT